MWQFGFVSAKVEQVSTQVERKTAIARAEAMIRDTERRATELSDRARELRIEAQTREIAAEREAEQDQKMRLALGALAVAAREAGLPKPSDAKEGDLEKRFSFAGRNLSGDGVYRTLKRWQLQVRRNDQNRETTRKMIERMRTAADQLKSKQQSMITRIGEVRSKLEELEIHRDLARVEKELAELGADVRGEFAGDLGKAMKTLQQEIDELQATADVLGKEPQAGASLTPDEVLAESGADPTVLQELDALWDG